LEDENEEKTGVTSNIAEEVKSEVDVTESGLEIGVTYNKREESRRSGGRKGKREKGSLGRRS